MGRKRKLEELFPKIQRLLGPGLESDSSDDDEQDKALKDDPIRLEVHRYRSEPKLPAGLCPLQDFWKKNCHRFPHLAKLVKKYLAVCASSTPAERAFSKLGLLLAKRRLSLDGENVNKIIFCLIIVCVVMYFKIKRLI